MINIFKEPLLVFLLLGGAMFVLFQQVSNDYQPDNSEISVTERRAVVWAQLSSWDGTRLSNINSGF